MTACCENICQHPACWKAEYDIQRSALKNCNGYFNNYRDSKSNFLRYDAKNDCIVNIDGSLPTYKTLDLVASGFPSNSGDGFYLPLLEFEEGAESNGPSKEVPTDVPEPSVNSRLANYLQKLCDRVVQVEAEEEEKLTKELSAKLFYKTLYIEEDESVGGHSRVYTWVPSTKPKCKSADNLERESKRQVVAMKMIDGTELPHEFRSSDTAKTSQRLHSRRKTMGNIPPIVDQEEYLKFLRYIDLTRFKCGSSIPPMSNQDVRIPSPLQTARVKLYDSSLETKSPRIKKSNSMSDHKSDNPVQPVKQLAEEVAVTTKRLKALKKGSKKLPDTSKPAPPKRTPLPLTRVSVPKKAVRHIPLFDHCSSSIKKTDLPEVTMQPILSSENTSIVSSEKSECLDEDEVLPSESFISPESARVPPSSPLGYDNTPKKKLTTFHDSKIDLVNAANVLPEYSEIERNGGKVFMNFNDQLLVDNTKITPCPSAIMISKASKSDTSLLDNRDICRHSPAASVSSKGSVDGWNIDKDIISRTYDKYQSFSPFKTPDCKDEARRMNDLRSNTSKRQILPPSLHNLDQYLPSGEETCLRPNTSFASRSLSPSRSMFHRQQKQPPIENVPSEIKISRFPLLPAITKSQRSSTHNITDTGHNLPLSSSFGYEVVGVVEDQYDEEVEKVLKKEDFSLDNLEYSMRSNVTSVPGVDISVDITKCQIDSNHSIIEPVQSETHFVQDYDDSNDTSYESEKNNEGEENALVSNSVDDIAHHNSSMSPASRTSMHSTVKPSQSDSPASYVPVDNFIPSVSDGNTDKRSLTSEDICSEGYYEERIPSARSEEFLKSVSPHFYNDNLPEGEEDSINGMDIHSPMMANSVTPSMVVSPLSPNALISPGMELNSITPESARIGASCEVVTSVVYSKEEGAENESVATPVDSNPISISQEGSPVEIIESHDPSDEPYKFSYFQEDIDSESTIYTNKSPVEIQTTPTMENSRSSKTSPTLKSPRDNRKDLSPNSISAKGASITSLSQTGSRLFRSSTILPEDPVQSVMKDIFNSQIVQKSSLFLTPQKADDFSEGLDMKLELDEEIVRAMNGLEEFVMDNYEAEVDDNE